MSIVINGTAESIQVVLDAAPATNQLPCTTSWADQGGAASDTSILTNGTTAVTIVPAAAAGVARVVSGISIVNADTATRIVTINKLVTATTYRVVRVSLPTNFQLYYENNIGWRVLDSNGNFIELVQSVQSGTWTVAVSNFPATQPVSGTVAATQSGTWTTGRTWTLASGTDSVSAVQSGTWTVQQGSAPWSDNISQWGGTSTTLGQKVSASSVPVVIASDQSNLPVTIMGATNVQGGQSLTTTTPVAVISAAFTRITSISILANVPVLAAGTVSLQVKDGGGTTIFSCVIPVYTSSGTVIYTVFNMGDLMIPMSNGGVNATAQLSANLTSGSINAYFGVK